MDSDSTLMEHQELRGGLSKSGAVASCIAMAVFYVGILYSPTLVLRLPPPDSFKSFFIRRFICAAISSVVSLFFCCLILPMKRWDAIELFGVYGIRSDHIWQALGFPLLLTSLMYSGSFTLKLLSMQQATCDHLNSTGNLSVYIKSTFLEFFNWTRISNVLSWRNYFVAPLTEELVFRACMIPLLLCGGFSTYTVIFLCPIFFSLAHLNHFVEIYIQQRCSLLKASAVVGFQLGYTVIFGAYASFLLIRSGHLAAPLVAHVFCNFMGLPAIVSQRSVPAVRSFLGQAVTERSAPAVDSKPFVQTESITDREKQLPATLTELEPLREVAIELFSSTESALPEGVADSHLGEQEDLPEVEGSPVERPQKRVRSDEAGPSATAPEIISGPSARLQEEAKLYM